MLLRCLLLIANGVPRKVHSPYYVLEPLCEGDVRSLFVLYYINYIFCRFKPRLTSWVWAFWVWAFVWKKPTSRSQLLGTLSDFSKSKSDLVVENALLRQQLIVLRRQVKHPQLTNTDRALMVLLVSKLRAWKNALLIVQPDTLLRWHRLGFRLFWKRKTKVSSRNSKVPAESVELIRQMAQENQLWGAERIRGELLKLDIHVCRFCCNNFGRHHIWYIHTE